MVEMGGQGGGTFVFALVVRGTVNERNSRCFLRGILERKQAGLCLHFSISPALYRSVNSESAMKCCSI